MKGHRYLPTGVMCFSKCQNQYEDILVAESCKTYTKNRRAIDTNPIECRMWEDVSEKNIVRFNHSIG